MGLISITQFPCHPECCQKHGDFHAQNLNMIDGESSLDTKISTRGKLSSTEAATTYRFQ